jgi:hypothetical protein
VKEMELQNWKMGFNWIKANAGHHTNELEDTCERGGNQHRNQRVLKKDSTSAVLSELGDHSVTKWQSEWDHTTKGVITKPFFPKTAERLKLKINITPNFTTMVRGHGNIKSYLHEYKILDSPMCFCKNGE